MAAGRGRPREVSGRGCARASPRRPPATCTWAARGRRSRRGCGRVAQGGAAPLARRGPGLAARAARRRGAHPRGSAVAGPGLGRAGGPAERARRGLRGGAGHAVPQGAHLPVRLLSRRDCARGERAARGRGARVPGHVPRPGPRARHATHPGAACAPARRGGGLRGPHPGALRAQPAARGRRPGAAQGRRGLLLPAGRHHRRRGLARGRRGAGRGPAGLDAATESGSPARSAPSLPGTRTSRSSWGPMALASRSATAPRRCGRCARRACPPSASWASSRSAWGSRRRTSRSRRARWRRRARGANPLARRIRGGCRCHS